jgi:hypothetical protein
MSIDNIINNNKIITMFEIEEIINQLQFESNFISKELIEDCVREYVENTVAVSSIEEEENLIIKMINKIY